MTVTERHPVTTRHDFADHRAMAGFWGQEAGKAIARAVAVPRPATIEDLDAQHAVRCARIACWHALKVIR